MSTNEKKPRRTFDREFIESAVKLVTSEGYSLAAAAWLGHSTIIANKHYWQVTDADIARAIKPVEAAAEEASDKAAQKAAHKAAQQVHAGGSKESHAKPPAHKKAPVLLDSALSRETVQNWGMGDEGLEPPTFCL